MSQDVLGTDIYIGNVFGEDVASVGCEKSDMYNPHTMAPRRAIYFCDLLFSRVLKIVDDFRRERRLWRPVGRH